MLKIFWQLKTIAIISVVIAHTNFSTGNTYRIYEIIGTIGVPIFLFISGYLYYYKNQMGALFLKKKLYKLIPIWLISSTLSYFIGITIGSKKDLTFQFFEYLKFFLGYGTIYYFLTILFLLYISSFKKRNITLKKLLFLIVLNVISIKISVVYTPKMLFLNPFNFICYFYFGIYVFLHEELFKKNIKNNSLLIWSIFVVSLFLRFKDLNAYAYFSTTSVFFNLSNIILMSSILKRSRFKNFELSKLLGKNSLYIYLFHMPLVSVFNRLLDQTIIKTTLILLIMTIILEKKELKNVKN